MTMACVDANASLKRSYSPDVPPSTPIDRPEFRDPFGGSRRYTHSRLLQHRMSLSLKRRYPFNSPSLNTDVGFGSSALSPILDQDVDMPECPEQMETNNSSSSSSSSTSSPSPNSHISNPKDAFSLRSNDDSPSTSIPSSTNCSPTTTISTVDSVTTENSPSSDCPVQIRPLSPFHKMSGLSSVEDLSVVPPSPGLGYNRSLSPSKKPRNTKNLSLTVPTPTTPSKRPQTSDGEPKSAQPSPRSMSAPNSPGFIVPPPPNPRRKPSNLGLTIKLPSTIPEKRTGALRHHQSSPSLFSPVTGPKGGMQMPASATMHPMQPRMFNPSRRPSLQLSCLSTATSACSSTNVSPPRTPPAVLAEMDEEDEEPLSQEARSPSYPNGPALIFEPNVYLYSEPNAELASTFDVVINVAREVVDPFTLVDEAKRAELKRPEYIHIPWDHNTTIIDDLPRLVDLLDSRVKQGKKILVHCQCGVSRSASLLIAYGMFKNPKNTVQQSYDAVKNKSKWIGPNMSLIYQLSDWRMQLNKQAQNPHGGSKSLLKSALEEQVPQTAPLQRPPLELPTASQGQSLTAYSGGVSPGPSSAPPGMMTIPKPPLSPCLSIHSTCSAREPERPTLDDKWESQSAICTSAPSSLAAPASLSTSMPPPPPSQPPPPPPPLAKAIIPDDAYTSFARRRLQAKERSAQRDWIARQQKSSSVLSDDEEPPTPSFKSPRNSGYFGFAMARAGLFGQEQQTGFIFADPRSPGMQEQPVVRSIFDVL